ncbi:uncharacterized protein LOC118201325 [Stegodyphus dumicola]|uniref:uncharacterized protein LOC118201325 n=1 Tax=Stegodyphus dumicola TaxID=202533 RepID=UPI0015B0ECA4|nr:uncharacterized protein LOC118201325 [Stegodyphus dumicola]
MTIVTMFVKDANISDLFSLDILGISDPVEVKSRKEKEFLTKKYFQETLRINDDGRYEVALPWKDDHLPLPTNKDIAIRRLQVSTKKLNSEKLFDTYDDVFKQWTELRIIYDVTDVHDSTPALSSSPTCSQGTWYYQNIEKAFLQVSVRLEERNYLRFFWWNDSDCKEIKVMQHNRLVFGVKSSPFLLGAVLDYHLGKSLNDARYNQDYVKILISSFYVDNLVTSLNDTCDILPFIETSQAILSEGKFNLRGWQYTNDNGPEPFTSVLGLLWDDKSGLVRHL